MTLDTLTFCTLYLPSARYEQHPSTRNAFVCAQMQMPPAAAPAPDGEAQQPASTAPEEPVSPPTALPSAGPSEEQIKKLLTKRQ